MFVPFMQRFSQPYERPKIDHPDRFNCKQVPAVIDEVETFVIVQEKVGSFVPEFCHVDGSLYDIAQVLRSGNSDLLQPVKSFMTADALNVQKQFDAFASHFNNIKLPIVEPITSE